MYQSIKKYIKEGLANIAKAITVKAMFVVVIWIIYDIKYKNQNKCKKYYA